MDEIHVFTPVCIADLEAAEDNLYKLRQQTKNKDRLKKIDKNILRASKQIQSFYSSLPTA